MNQNSLRFLKIALLFSMICLTGSAWAQWHQYAFRDTFQVAAGVPTVLDVLANDDLNPSPTDINYVPNPVTVDYSFPFGALTSENGGTLVILNNDSIQYTPPMGFTGPDRFYYGIGDSPGSGALDTAQVFVEVGGATGIEEVEISSFVLYPNPVTDVLRVAGNQQVDAMEIFNMEGSLVASGTEEVTVEDLPNGLYVVRIGVGLKTVYRRFLKE